MSGNEDELVEQWHQLQSGRTPAEFTAERVTVTNASRYTEVTHTLWADVAGAPPMDGGSLEPYPEKMLNPFVPSRVTVKWRVRTQLGESDWGHPSFEISGPYLSQTQLRYGSCSVLMSMATAPEWAKAFAEANRPVSKLVEE